MELHKFNKTSAVNKLHIRHNKNKYIKIGTILICIFIVSFCVLFYTYSKFTTSKKFKVVQTTVGDFSTKDYSIAYYLDDVSIDAAPTSNSGDGILKITCNNDATATWNKDTWNISITSTKTGTKCSVYFTSDSTKVDNSYYTAVNTTSDDYKAGYSSAESDSKINGEYTLIGQGTYSAGATNTYYTITCNNEIISKTNIFLVSKSTTPFTDVNLEVGGIPSHIIIKYGTNQIAYTNTNYEYQDRIALSSGTTISGNTLTVKYFGWNSSGTVYVYALK
jgi:hypothetical protein